RLELRPASLPAIVDRALQSVTANWNGPAVRIARQYEDHLPEVAVDERFCEQIFVNLAQNAFEAMENGGQLTISILRAQRGERRGVEVSFADTGPGISAELRGQIFNPFFTTKKTGTGLGLSIVSKIVDEHDGSMELAAESIGARFILFFPLVHNGGA